MSDSGQTYVDQCRYLARRLRLEACKAPGVPILVRLDYSDVEGMARMLERAGAVERGLRYVGELRGMRATRPYLKAIEHETWARRYAWILAGVLLRDLVEASNVLLAAVFG